MGSTPTALYRHLHCGLMAPPRQQPSAGSLIECHAKHAGPGSCTKQPSLGVQPYFSKLLGQAQQRLKASPPAAANRALPHQARQGTPHGPNVSRWWIAMACVTAGGEWRTCRQSIAAGGMHGQIADCLGLRAGEHSQLIHYGLPQPTLAGRPRCHNSKEVVGLAATEDTCWAC